MGYRRHYAILLDRKGNVIKEGVNSELDELRNLSKSGKDYLQKILERETERTGIPSLKISFNGFNSPVLPA